VFTKIGEENVLITSFRTYNNIYVKGEGKDIPVTGRGGP
jgi:hypothetical protein